MNNQPASKNLAVESLGDLSPDARFRVGTLVYTRAGLVILFVWLLWGDFCFTLMETVLPGVLTLNLRHLNASNTLIGLLITTIPSAMNFLINPVVSFKSDRYRSRWGRRIPFLLFATPFVTLFLILLGFSKELGLFLHAQLSQWMELSPTAVILGLIAVLMVAFQFFNMFISSVYYYLFNDVVPEAYLARCMALFRVVGTGANSFYSFFVYKYAETHMKQIFLGASLLYFVAFVLMCWKVREGEYPPPQANLGNQKGIAAGAKTYFTECFTHKFYWHFFLMNASWQLANCVGAFGVFLYLSIGLDLDKLGWIGGWAGMISMVLLYPAGILADRFHSIRVMMITLVLYLLTTPISFIYLFYDLSSTAVYNLYIVMACIGLPVGVMYSAASGPFYMRMLPKDRYGQFGSADAMVRSIITILGGLVAGLFMDLMKRITGGDPYYYRFIPCWSFLFQGIALVFMLLLYRGWKQHGGPEHYVPPMPLEPTTIMPCPEVKAG